MLDISGKKNIRNAKVTIIESFLEGFQVVLECLSIRFDASLGSWHMIPLLPCCLQSISTLESWLAQYRSFCSFRCCFSTHSYLTNHIMLLQNFSFC